MMIALKVLPTEVLMTIVAIVPFLVNPAFNFHFHNSPEMA